MPLPSSTFEPHRPAVYGWALKVVSRHEDALDITQDVCLKWLTRSDSDRLLNPRAWLRTVTVNRALDTLRARKANPASPADLDTVGDTQPGPITLLAQTELRAKVQSALATLTENQRAVLVAKVFDGETFAQIAQDMNLAIPTVKTHYLRALAALESQLRDAR
jgi:RNA polymerase sigma factor (sigma-70 family)